MKASIGRILKFCSACIAFYIGVGFATMQEVMQYEALYGSRFWIVILVAAIFAVFIFLGIYTSACPLLWTGVRAIAKDGSQKV